MLGSMLTAHKTSVLAGFTPRLRWAKGNRHGEHEYPDPVWKPKDWADPGHDHFEGNLSRCLPTEGKRLLRGILASRRTGSA